jgi:predicted kinase
MKDRLPLLAVVCGRPGAGKTTLAKALGAELRCPVLGRDEFKEGYLRTEPQALDADAARAANQAFFDCLALLLQEGISTVAETAFQHKLWAPNLEPFLPFADVRLVICDLSPEAAFARRQERERQDPGRLTFHPHLPSGGEWLAPELAVPTLMVSTANGYQRGIPEIVEFLS